MSTGNNEVEPTRDGNVITDSSNVNQNNGRAGGSVDVLALDAESFRIDSSPEGARVAVDQTFDLLRSEMGEIGELKVDGVYKDFTAEHVKDMDPVSRRILHNARVAVKLAENEAAARVAAAEKATSDRNKLLSEAEKDLTRRMRDFAAVSKNPEIVKLLATPEGELPPIHTQEGIQARIKLGVAQQMKAFLEPMQRAAEAEDAKVQYIDWLEKNPDVKEPAMKKAVAALVRSRAEAGNPIERDDALALVRAQKAVAEQRRLAEATRASRAESNAHVATRASAGSPGGETIPKDVAKRGAAAINSWLNQNPAAKQRYMREALGR